MKLFDEKAKIRFQKIVTLMHQGAHEGEREAARAAAIRMSAQYDLTLDEAISECQIDQKSKLSLRQRTAEQKDRADSYNRWGQEHSFATEATQRAQKMAWEQAMHSARARGYDESEANINKHKQRTPYVPRYRPSNYKPTVEDFHRLIRGLLLDGASIKTTANLANTTTENVVKVWLMLKAESPHRVFKRKPTRSPKNKASLKREARFATSNLG